MAAAAAAEVASWIYMQSLRDWPIGAVLRRAPERPCAVYLYLYFTLQIEERWWTSLSLSLVLSPPLYNISYESIWRFFFFRLKPSGQTTSGRHGSSAANAAEDTPFRWDYTLNNATVLADSACGVVDSFVQSLVRSFVCSLWCVALFSILYYKRFRTDVEICIWMPFILKRFLFWTFSCVLCFLVDKLVVIIIDNEP